MPEMIPVVSSNIRAVGYEPGEKDLGTLTIEFANGRTYLYHDVEPDRFDELTTAPSIGKVFASTIRGRYLFEPV